MYSSTAIKIELTKCVENILWLETIMRSRVQMAISFSFIIYTSDPLTVSR